MVMLGCKVCDACFYSDIVNICKGVCALTLCLLHLSREEFFLYEMDELQDLLLCIQRQALNLFYQLLLYGHTFEPPNEIGQSIAK
mgnify:CR=1 FL=1